MALDRERSPLLAQRVTPKKSAQWANAEGRDQFFR
jgi:hypothetical protein